ncbi:MAG: flagellar export chaperone FliS [Gammaproteobacteria bacterium]|jgi:flagellar protein FliS|nr:flagellar export chaperone FliS [Gammaproteobacteria bacterium]
MNQTALQQYQAIGVQSGVTDASPHQLISMLISGAADRIAAARGAMERGETARKGELISKAISIVDGLRASLDRDNGGEVAANLGALYDYIEQGLVEANLRSDVARLDEAARLLGEVREAWNSIPAEQR